MDRNSMARVANVMRPALPDGIEPLESPPNESGPNELDIRIGATRRLINEATSRLTKTPGVAMVEGPFDFNHPLLRHSISTDRGAVVSDRNKDGRGFNDGPLSSMVHATVVSQMISGFIKSRRELKMTGESELILGAAPRLARLTSVDVRSDATRRGYPSTDDIVAGLDWVYQRKPLHGEDKFNFEFAVVALQKDVAGRMSHPSIKRYLNRLIRRGITPIIPLGDKADSKNVMVDCPKAIYAGVKHHHRSLRYPKRTLLIPTNKWIACLPMSMDRDKPEFCEAFGSSIAAGIVAAALLLVRNLKNCDTEDALAALVENTTRDGLLNVLNAIGRSAQP